MTEKICIYLYIYIYIYIYMSVCARVCVCVCVFLAFCDIKLPELFNAKTILEERQ